MPDDQMNLQGQALAAIILRAIDKAMPPRGVALSALGYCRNQTENRTAVETAVLVAGCSSHRLSLEAELELYYDILKNDEEITSFRKAGMTRDFVWDNLTP